MSSTQTAANELRQILRHYGRNSYGTECPDIEIVRSFLSGVSDNERFGLFSSIRDSDNLTVLTKAAVRGHTELCVTLFSSLPPSDRLKMVIVNKYTALHHAACQGYTETVSGILNCLTAEQQLKLLFTQDKYGDTALHEAALWGRTETVKTLLDHLTPEQQLKHCSTQNNYGNTELHVAALQGHAETVKTLLDNLTPEQQLKLLSVHNKKGMTASDTMRTLKHYQIEADYRVNYRKFAIIT